MNNIEPSKVPEHIRGFIPSQWREASVQAPQLQLQLSLIYLRSIWLTKGKHVNASVTQQQYDIDVWTHSRKKLYRWYSHRNNWASAVWWMFLFLSLLLHENQAEEWWLWFPFCSSSMGTSYVSTMRQSNQKYELEYVQSPQWCWSVSPEALLTCDRKSYSEFSVYK